MHLIEIKNKFLQSTSYIIKNYLIDCGDGKKINSILRKYKIELKGILLTHCHIDHIYGLEEVVTAFPEAKIYCSASTLAGLKDENLNLQYICPEYAFRFVFEDRIVIFENSKYMLDDGIVVDVIPTKGHSNDSQSYIIENNIFTGDAYIPGIKTFTKWPTSNRNDAIISEQLILNLSQEHNLFIKPGHWD